MPHISNTAPAGSSYAYPSNTRGHVLHPSSNASPYEVPDRTATPDALRAGTGASDMVRVSRVPMGGCPWWSDPDEEPRYLPRSEVDQRLPRPASERRASSRRAADMRTQDSHARASARYAVCGPTTAGAGSSAAPYVATGLYSHAPTAAQQPANVHPGYAPRGNLMPYTQATSQQSAAGYNTVTPYAPNPATTPYRDVPRGQALDATPDTPSDSSSDSDYYVGDRGGAFTSGPDIPSDDELGIDRDDFVDPSDYHDAQLDAYYDGIAEAVADADLDS